MLIWLEMLYVGEFLCILVGPTIVAIKDKYFVRLCLMENEIIVREAHCIPVVKSA